MSKTRLSKAEDEGDLEEYEDDDEDEDDWSDEDDEKSRYTCEDFTDAVVRKRCCIISCSVFVLILAALVAGLARQGWAQVTLSRNRDSFHAAWVTPPDFPRYMDCSNGTVPECAPRINKSDELIERCTSPCYGLNLVLAWEKFAQTHPYRLVYFPSRPGPEGQEKVNISAWWLPADPARVPPGTTAPRIVVLHGLSSNNNHCGVQNSCYLLRSMGFSCLTPTVRDYGLSGKSSHPETLTWGYDYHLDLLGAWDYAVNDPDGILGGPLPKSQVGIMGFSKGALATAIAFGKDQDIPAAWIDSAPWGGLSEAVDKAIRPYAKFLTPLVRAPVVLAAKYWSPVPIDYFRALPLIKNCSPYDRRHVMISGARDDKTVPFEESDHAIVTIGGLQECYGLWIWTPEESCNGQHHHQWMWEFPDIGRRVLCRFWSHAFKRNQTVCGLDGYLPDLDLWNNVITG